MLKILIKNLKERGAQVGSAKSVSIKSGSAMILTMFILAGMLIVAMSGSYIVLLGIKSGGTQAQSIKAYFAAEAGMESLLYQTRQAGLVHGPANLSKTSPLIEGDLESEGLSYAVFFTAMFPKRTFASVGDYQTTKRSVEVSW